MKSKQFHRLDQLDRIEFLLVKEKEHENFTDSIITFKVINIIFIAWFVIFSTGMLFYIGFESIAILKLLWLLDFKAIFLWGLVLSLIFDGFIIYTHKVRSKKLDNHFLKRGGLK